MDILALDLGRVMGWAKGEDVLVLLSGSVALAKQNAPQSMIQGSLLTWLQVEFAEWERRAALPHLILCEAPLALRAYTKLGTSEMSVRSAYAMHGIVSAFADRWGIGCREVAVASYTRHFTGRAVWGGREERKRAMIGRARQLRWMHPEDADDNRADALGLWDWGQSVMARTPPKELVLF